MGHLVTEGDKVGQAGFAFPKPLMAEPDPLFVLVCCVMALKVIFSMTFLGTESVVPWILLLDLLVDEHHIF